MKSLLTILIVLGLTQILKGQDTLIVTSFDSVAKSTSSEYLQAERKIDRLKFYSYPKLPATSRTLSSFVPAGWKIVDSVSGDLNSDRVPDLSLVLQYRDTVNEIRPDNLEYENVPRMLVLIFRDKKRNTYKLALQNNFIIPRAGEGKQRGDPFRGLKVQANLLTIGGPMGGEYIFRFQNGEFYLVKAWTNGIKRISASDENTAYEIFYYVEIDFLKSEALIRESISDDSDEKQKHKKVSLSRKALLKLKNLKEFDDRNIFRGLVE